MLSWDVWPCACQALLANTLWLQACRLSAAVILMQGVTARRQDAQQRVLQLLSQHAPAILVGHALHNDLRALRLDVHPAIDTSKLFKYRCSACFCLFQHPLLVPVYSWSDRM